ncbi:unnamed protein product [Adineta steineri]|uniref:V-SNARE coiled-coil homology domain-containing protein n=1 Tax=Adineta steineri TaxID=433720 RepID=A0A815DEG8_9BILA|nr:unnamed protein product [Adineta steineri]
MATAGYTRPQTYSSIRDDDDDALDIQIDSDTTRSTAGEGVKKLHGQVQEVVGVMKKNIDRLLDRDVALNNLMTRADDLETSASTYNQTTKTLLQEVVGVMKKNIDRLLDRDVALNNLMTRADDLETSASTYNQTTKTLRRKYWWKNAKTNVCIAGIVVAVIFIIIIIIAFNRLGKK